MTNENSTYDKLIDQTKQTHILHATTSLLNWDQEVMMPGRAVAFRSRQIAQLARLGHVMATDPRIHELLEVCEADDSLVSDPLSITAVNLREIRRAYDRATKLPARLVSEFAQVTSLARHEWSEARKQSDFERFAPHLNKIVELNRRKAECYGWPEDGEAWDALADGYQTGCTAAYVESVFVPLRDRLIRLVRELADSQISPNGAFNEHPVPIEQQRSFVRYVAQQIGFDFERGRLDESAHPFCSGTHVHDTRMTTRFGPTNLLDALGSTIHECGHGIYNQNLPGLSDDAYIGTPLGSSVSYSIHESQSRLWENQVGRSWPFWCWCYPKMTEHLGPALGSFTLEQVYGAANLVQPSLIRVEADEATYNLHIMVRFEIERELISGEIDGTDLPKVWNDKYQEYLGVQVPDDRRGCLQDIHWAQGAMGYFPTYTLGNLYAAQFFETAQEQLSDLPDQLAAGHFAPLKAWLGKHIHSQGMRYDTESLCQHVSAKPLSADALMRHLESKLRPLYGL